MDKVASKLAVIPLDNEVVAAAHSILQLGIQLKKCNKGFHIGESLHLQQNAASTGSKSMVAYQFLSPAE